MGLTRKNEVRLVLDKDILSLVDYYSMATGTDRAQVCKVAILHFFQSGTPDASASMIVDNLDFSTLESFIESAKSLG